MVVATKGRADRPRRRKSQLCATSITVEGPLTTEGQASSLSSMDLAVARPTRSTRLKIGKWVTDGRGTISSP